MQKTLPTRFSVWIALLLTSLAMLWAPSAAHAHDVLVESTPEVGSTTETTPSEVRLRFSGTPLTGEGLTNLILVTDAEGNQWHDGEVSVEGYELAIPLCENLPQGEYEVAYRVIYSDGHTGEERFSFTNADQNAPAEGTPDNCGEMSDGAATPDTPEANETQDTSNAQDNAAENTSASLPGWVWIVGGVGIIVIAGVIFSLLRDSRTGQTPEDPVGDE